MLICSKSKYNSFSIPPEAGSQYYKKIGNGKSIRKKIRNICQVLLVLSGVMDVNLIIPENQKVPLGGCRDQCI